jgi:hypothetical protein
MLILAISTMQNKPLRTYVIGLFILDIILFSLLVVSFLKSKQLEQSNRFLKLLSVIQKISMERGIIQFTNVAAILKDSPEIDLTSGSKVKILTYEFSSFDTNPNAICVIAKNLTNDAIYEYYLPENKDTERQIQKINILLKNEMMRLHADTIKIEKYMKNIHYYLFNGNLYPSLFNFVIIDRAESSTKDRFAWYITENEENNNSGERKAISSKLTTSEERTLLYEAFLIINHASKKYI